MTKKEEPNPVPRPEPKSRPKKANHHGVPPPDTRKFTRKVMDDILKYLSLGHSERSACMLAGINDSTLRRQRHMADPEACKKYGRDVPDPVLVEFFTIEVPRAKELKKNVAHRIVMNAMVDDQGGLKRGTAALATAKWYLTNYGGDEMVTAKVTLEHSGDPDSVASAKAEQFRQLVEERPDAQKHLMALMRSVAVPPAAMQKAKAKQGETPP